jgi:hypothetical protein
VPAPPPIALGFKAHTGWAAVVIVSGPAHPSVIAKARIEMAADFDSAAVYHASEDLPVAKAAALIEGAEKKFTAAAIDGLQAQLAPLHQQGRRPVVAGIVSADGRPLPPLENILKAHTLIHSAEGELFRQILARACQRLEVPVVFVPAKQLASRAAASLDVTPAGLTARMQALGKSSGRPWAEDQKHATLAALVALAERRTK